ncbi:MULTISPECIES: hypothetical protein [unclassified Halorubrum]|uniref:hypothetical protein n=1 Tax=unclassified Halorubrum TaxID=2642239 RepID=UPI0010F9FAD4|nr:MULTISPECIES: hypothetical protein [unclassified Halorubrum]TKX45123.1 hypothetical protein EXE50_03905 [Halorubrum sp. ARQ200]TKX49396.1 hypothetical protein EXE49_11925 [Halorubrum sp. ASP121]TKX58328.1 hypothetical protein EXE48_16595 [Halorubrum sp. ASP1]
MPSESGPATAADAVDAVEPSESVGDAERDEAAGRDDSAATDGADATGGLGREAIEWGPVRYDRLRSLAAGATGGIAGAVLVGIGAVVAAVLTGIGEFALPSVGLAEAAVGVGFLFALVVATVPSLYVWYRETAVSELTVSRLREAAGALRPGWTLAGLGAVAAAAVALPSDLLPAFWPLFWLVWFVPAVVQSSGKTVRLDPAAATVERTYPSYDRTRSDDLGSVVRTRRVDLRSTTLFLLAYRGNAWFRSTPWLFVPTHRADEVEAALDAVLAESDGPDRASVPERLTLAVLGSFSLVVGLLMAVAAGEGAGGVALALLTAPFSLLFLALAARL